MANQPTLRELLNEAERRLGSIIGNVGDAHYSDDDRLGFCLQEATAGVKAIMAAKRCAGLIGAAVGQEQ